MYDINKQFCEKPKESWQIENQIKLFMEAIMEGEETIRKENFDLDRKEKMKKALERLMKQFSEFKNIKWTPDSLHSTNKKEV